MEIHIGCGSWADQEYGDVLYPRGTPATERLAAYARRFDHVEVNSTYYATPRRDLVANWVEQTPPDFLFELKLHRAFSQNPGRTATESDLVPRLLAGVQPLLRAKKLNAFLLVLTPGFSPAQHQLEELDPLIELLRPHRLAVELRHRDWVDRSNRDATLGFFRERRLVWVAVDMPRIAHATLMPPVDAVTSEDLAYLRLHGRNPQYLEAHSAAERHAYPYSNRELAGLARRVRRLGDRAHRVWVVANNHAHDFAARTALKLQELLAADVAAHLRKLTIAKRCAAPMVEAAATHRRSRAVTRRPRFRYVNHNQGKKMAKTKNAKKQTKKAPQKTAKQKKQAKRSKK